MWASFCGKRQRISCREHLRLFSWRRLLIWFLQTFDPHLNVVSNSQQSLLAVISGVIAPLFAPMGLGDWRVCTALLTGFMAKESVVSTLSVLFGTTQSLRDIPDPSFSGQSAGFLPALYAVRGSDLIGQTRTGRKMGLLCRGGAVRDCVDRSVCGLSFAGGGNVGFD